MTDQEIDQYVAERAGKILEEVRKHRPKRNSYVIGFVNTNTGEKILIVLATNPKIVDKVKEIIQAIIATDQVGTHKTREHPKLIQVQQCHVNDFKNHNGWWALFPTDSQLIALRVGDQVEFDLAGVEKVPGVITRIIGPGDPDRSVEQSDFTNWTIIEYKA